MFTTFSVIRPQLGGIKGLFSFLLGDKILEDYLELEDITVRRITYVSRRNSINWDNVYTRAGYEAKCLVCDDSIRLPPESGLIRFRDKSLEKRMTENFAYSVLCEMGNPQNISVAFFDADGSRSDFAESLSQITDNFIVVTGDKNRYAQISRRLMEEQGISLVITNKLRRMEDSRLIIAPSKIRRELKIGSKAVVLTGDAPCCNMNGQCYFNFRIDLPDRYKNLVTGEIDPMYLASSLYSRGRQYNLGSIVPYVAYNSGATCTVKSLAKYLDKTVTKS